MECYPIALKAMFRFNNHAPPNKEKSSLTLNPGDTVKVCKNGTVIVKPLKKEEAKRKIVTKLAKTKDTGHPLFEW